jgi:hypothetical protein
MRSSPWATSSGSKSPRLRATVSAYSRQEVTPGKHTSGRGHPQTGQRPGGAWPIPRKPDGYFPGRTINHRS